MHLKKPSQELVFDLINQDNQNRFQRHHLQLGTPESTGGGTRNTRLSVSGDGQDYTGQVVVTYNRLDLSVAMPALEPEGLEVMVPNDGFVHTGEITDRLNLMYDLALAPEDLVYQELAFDSFPASLTLSAHPTSYAWRGTLDIQLVPDRPMFADVLNGTVLDGFTIPPGDGSHLSEPVALFDQTLNLQDQGFLHYQHNGVSLSAEQFMISHNSELWVGLSPRAGDLSTGEPREEDGYYLQLTDEQGWGLVFSVHLDSPTQAEKITDLYDIQIEVISPDEHVCKWLLSNESGTLGFQLEVEEEIDYTAPGLEIDGGRSYQGVIDMAQVVSALGTSPLNEFGVPVGTYRVRLQARRRETLAPRLLTSFMVHVGDFTGQ